MTCVQCFQVQSPISDYNANLRKPTLVNGKIIYLKKVHTPLGYFLTCACPLRSSLWAVLHGT